ncbi:MAG: Rieske 2Fe-2S domain-containing protein [Chloroflexota bacterium]
MKFIVGKTDEIPVGGRKIVRVAGRSVGIFNVAGEFYAIRNRCPHQGAALCEGKLWGALRSEKPGTFEYDETKKDVLACIQHGWEFSLKTGQSWCDPARLRVRAYEVTVERPPASMPVATLDRVKNPMIETVNSAIEEAAAAPIEGDPDAPAPGMVKGPYTAETFPVAVEEGFLYLVMDVVEVGTPALPNRNEARR